MNTAAASIAFEVTIDTQAPTLVTFAENGQTLKNNQPFLSGSADANARITVIIDGDNEYTTVADDAGQWTLAVTIDLENGEHSVITVASDDAGNEVIATGSVTIDVSVSYAVTITVVVAVGTIIIAVTIIRNAIAIVVIIGRIAIAIGVFGARITTIAVIVRILVVRNTVAI